ncbi:hypothetical protein C8Q73DRAFT_696974 [Cubamyces lactineus]|nr:hypothetical protein C8Q73DRAFT_696974 [Cubamyces lactineus]
MSDSPTRMWVHGSVRPSLFPASMRLSCHEQRARHRASQGVRHAAGQSTAGHRRCHMQRYDSGHTA